MERKWLYIIGIDVIAAFYFWFINYYDELGFLFANVLAMGLSGLAGLFLLCNKQMRHIGYSLLYNIFLIPLLFLFFAIIGDYWHQYRRHVDDIKYEFCYQNNNFEMVLYGNSSDLFEIDVINGKTIKNVMTGRYSKIHENKYVLLSHANFISKETNIEDVYTSNNKDTMYNILHQPIVIDTIIMDKYTLFNLFLSPIPIKRK